MFSISEWFGGALQNQFAQSTGPVEYTDCTSAER